MNYSPKEISKAMLFKPRKISIADLRHITISEATILVQEKEKEELSRKLLENINQVLSVSKMYIGIAMSTRAKKEDLLLKSHDHIGSAIEEIRLLSKKLIPPLLIDFGLKAAIEEMIADCRQIATGITFTVKTKGLHKKGIPQEMQLMIYRIIQEQVTNVLRHSKATTASIVVIYEGKMVYINISDNGIGCDSPKSSKGLGLRSIENRSRFYKGRYSFFGKAGKGCRLEVHIPLQ